MIEFKDHIIELDTKEKSMDNCLVTVLISTKPESMNQILGYRCKYPKCYFIELNLDDAYEHVKCYHKIDRPFQCNACKAVFSDTDQLLMHKKCDHNDYQNNCDKQHIIRFECINRNTSTNNTRSTSNTNRSNDSETVVIPMKDNDYLECVQMRTTGKVLSYRCKWQKCDYSESKKTYAYNHVRHHFEKESIDKHFSSHEQSKRHRYEGHESRDRVRDTRKKSKRMSEVRESEINDKRKDNPKGLTKCDQKNSFKNHTIGIETFDKIEKNGLIAYVFSKKQEFNATNFLNRCLGYRCLYSNCDFISAYRTAVDKHITDKHGLECGRQYKCANCDDVFNSELERDGHLVVRHNSNNDVSVSDEQINNANSDNRDKINA